MIGLGGGGRVAGGVATAEGGNVCVVDAALGNLVGLRPVVLRPFGVEVIPWLRVHRGHDEFGCHGRKVVACDHGSKSGELLQYKRYSKELRNSDRGRRREIPRERSARGDCGEKKGRGERERERERSCGVDVMRRLSLKRAIRVPKPGVMYVAN